jgi:DNA-binding NtrC family response regulator
MSKNLNGELRALVDELVSRGLTLGQARREFERQFIVAALRSHDGNLGGSAKSLGIHRNTLRNKVGDLGIAAEDYAPRRRRSRSRA